MADTDTQDVDPYAELAQLTKDLATYRRFREYAIQRRDEAIAEEEQNIRTESGRIENAEARVRELVAELGLT